MIKVGAILREKKIVEDNWWNLSQGGDCWKIASNSNCDLESQLGFLVEEGKIIWVSLLLKERLFLGVE